MPAPTPLELIPMVLISLWWILLTVALVLFVILAIRKLRERPGQAERLDDTPIDVDVDPYEPGDDPL